MSRQLNPAQIWSQVPVANRLIEVNTKTGFSLTAGSYSVRASSTQGYSGNLNAAISGTTAISSVTVTRTVLAFGGCRTVVTTLSESLSTQSLTNATTVTIEKGTSANGSQFVGMVLELF